LTQETNFPALQKFLMHMKTRTIFLTLGFLTLAQTPRAQSTAVAKPQALVTFYSHGVTPLGGLPGHGSSAFKGRIYEGDHQLAFMEPAHFVTFSFDPGPHMFSATWWTTTHAKGGAHVAMELDADQHYFIEAVVLNSGFAFGNVNLFIKEVTCEGAQADNLRTKPLEPTHLRPDGAPIAVADKYFPKCP
jgi:hypothetical protein